MIIYIIAGNEQEAEAWVQNHVSENAVGVAFGINRIPGAVFRYFEDPEAIDKDTLDDAAFVLTGSHAKRKDTYRSLEILRSAGCPEIMISDPEPDYDPVCNVPKENLSLL